MAEPQELVDGWFSCKQDLIFSEKCSLVIPIGELTDGGGGLRCPTALLPKSSKGTLDLIAISGRE